MLGSDGEASDCDEDREGFWWVWRERAPIESEEEELEGCDPGDEGGDDGGGEGEGELEGDEGEDSEDWEEREETVLAFGDS